MTIEAIIYGAIGAVLAGAAWALHWAGREYVRRSAAIDRTMAARHAMRQFFFFEREKTESDVLDLLWAQYTSVPLQTHLAAELDGDDPISLYPPLFASLYRAWKHDQERILKDSDEGQDWSANAI